MEVNSFAQVSGREILTGGTAVLTSAQHTFGTDALLLARFSPPHTGWQAVDLCSGCGIVSLEWHDLGHRGPCFGVEIDPQASALLAQAVAEQALVHIQPVCMDLNEYARLHKKQNQKPVDLVACNPPYFTAGQTAEDPARARARHEQACTLQQVTQAAAALLRDGGRFVLCHRPERLAEVITVLCQNRLEPKRLSFVKNKVDGRPWLFLLEAQKNRKAGLKIEADTIVEAGAALYGPAAKQGE